MSKTVLQFALMFVVVVVAQAVIFNHIALFGVALAFVFIYFIIKLPLTLTPAKVIFLSFILGFTMDVFQDTPGMNALACTCLGGCRKTVLRLYLTRDDDLTHAIPSIRSFGAAVFAKYVLSMSLLFCAFVFAIESFTFMNLRLMLMRIAASTLLTSTLLIATDSLALPATHEKRL